MKPQTPLEEETLSSPVDEIQLMMWRRRYEEVEAVLAKLIREKNMLRIMIETAGRFMSGEEIIPPSSLHHPEQSSRSHVPHGIVKQEIIRVVQEMRGSWDAPGIDDQLKNAGVKTSTTYISLVLRNLYNQKILKKIGTGLYEWNGENGRDTRSSE